MKLFYKQYGENGPAIIILHGIFGMLDNWHNVARKLSEHYTVYTLDARNHGQSPHTDEMSYQAMAEDVIEFADTHQLSDFILVGHSMGGKTAMWTASQFPDRISKLVLVDIAPKKYKPGHDQYFKAFENIPWTDMQSRKEIDEALQQYEPEAGVRLFLAKNVERLDEGGFAVKSNIAALKEAYTEIIDKLNFTKVYQGPVLFILGAKSHYLDEADKPYIEQFFPKAKYVTVPNAGHWVHADNPTGFIQTLENFLAQS